MLTVVHARRQHGSVWRTNGVLCVVLIWSCNYTVASYHCPSLGMFCKRDVCILALIIPVLMFMSFVPDANLFEYLVPGFAPDFGPSKAQICTLYFSDILQKQRQYKSIKPIRAPDQTLDRS